MFWRPTNRVETVTTTDSSGRQRKNLFTLNGQICRRLLCRDVPVRDGKTCVLRTAESLSLAAENCDPSDRRTQTSAKTSTRRLHDQLSLPPLPPDWSNAPLRSNHTRPDWLGRVTWAF